MFVSLCDMMIMFFEVMDDGCLVDVINCFEFEGFVISKGEVYMLKLKDVLDCMVFIDYDILLGDLIG